MITLRDAFLTPARFDRDRLQLTGAAYDAAGQVVPASQRAHRKRWRPADPPALPRPEEGLRLEAALYLGHLFAHFGHFLVECLTSLWHGLDRDEPLAFHPWGDFTPKALRLPYVAQSLEALGIPRDRIVLADRPILVGRLDLPPSNQAFLGHPQREALAVYPRLASALCRGMPDFEARLVYMSRRFFRKSLRAANEAEVEREFARRGFRIVFPEQLTFREQVHLARNAEVLAGVGGSALHLSGFMQAGGRTLVVGSKMLPALSGINDGIGVGTTLLSPVRPAPEGSRYEYEVDADALGGELERQGLGVKVTVP